MLDRRSRWLVAALGAVRSLGRLSRFASHGFTAVWSDSECGNRGQAAAEARHERYALELKDVRKSFGKTAIIRGVAWRSRRASATPSSGPNGAGKSTLFNLYQRALRAQQRRDPV